MKLTSQTKRVDTDQALAVVDVESEAEPRLQQLLEMFDYLVNTIHFLGLQLAQVSQQLNHTCELDLRNTYNKGIRIIDALQGGMHHLRFPF
jgi:ActR/RegA family two-component response regulator